MLDYPDTYLVDDRDLRSLTTRVEVAEDLTTTPAAIGEDVPLPGLDGALPVYGELGQPRRPDSPGRITFDMSLAGVDPVTGEWASLEHSALYWFQQWDELVRLFRRRRLTIDHPRPDGTTRRAIGYVAERLEPVRVPAAPWFGRFRVSVVIPAGRWTDIDPVTTGFVSLSTGGILALDVFADATAVCTDLLVRFGPQNNPQLTSTTNRVAWNNTITTGRQLLIDTTTGATSSGAGSAWTPGYDYLEYSPGPRLFEVDPAEPLTAVLTHTGGGTAQVEVSGRRHYATS